jgi:hypothetical protein
MESINKTLLKNGIRGMISENEGYFKENVIKTLSYKLNESLKEVRHAIGQSVFMEEDITKNTKEVQNLVNFCESFKPGKYKFKDDFVLNITESDIENVKWLFEHLGSDARQKMAGNLFKSPSDFKQHVEFSKSIKGKL